MFSSIPKRERESNDQEEEHAYLVHHARVLPHAWGSRRVLASRRGGCVAGVGRRAPTAAPEVRKGARGAHLSSWVPLLQRWTDRDDRLPRRVRGGGAPRRRRVHVGRVRGCRGQPSVSGASSTPNATGQTHPSATARVSFPFPFSSSSPRADDGERFRVALPSNDPPTQAIDEGTSSGAIHAWVAEKAKAKFRELHDALRASAARRDALSVQAEAEAATLRKLLEDRAAAEARGENLVVETEWVQRELTEEEEAMIDAMVDDARRAEDEADLAEARLHKTDTELYELTRRRDALRRRRREAEEEHEAALAPAVSKLRAETLELRDEIKADAERLRVAREERDAVVDTLQACVAEAAERAGRRSAAEAATKSLRGVPEKTRERCLVLEDAAETLRRRDASLGARVAALNAEMEAQSERVVRMTETFSRRVGALEKAKLADEAVARDADDVGAALETAGFEGDALLETKASAELDRRRAVSDRDAAVSALRRATKDKDQTLRRLRRAQLAKERVDEEVPAARSQLHKLKAVPAVLPRLTSSAEEVQEAAARAVEKLSRMPAAAIAHRAHGVRDGVSEAHSKRGAQQTHDE